MTFAQTASRAPRLLATAAAPIALLTGLLAAGLAQAGEEAIRKALAERMPDFKVDEVSKTPIPGLYEIRMGTDIIYADENGDHLIQGAIFNTRTKVNLTKVREDKLLRIDFASLSLKDAIVVKQGNGSRKIAVFADPNCGYCKRLERDLLTLKDVTIYNFIIPILGADSQAKARDIWCSKDNAKVWRSWMLDGTVPARSMDARCDLTALERNLAYSQKNKINGTPAIFFEDGSRAPGAIPAAQIEKQMQAAAKS